jgi:hypothetical protein
VWLVALFLFWSVLLATALALQRSRGAALAASGDCPRCTLPMEILAPPVQAQPPRSWSVLACAKCAITLATVQGIPNRAAWCPKCQQRALEVGITHTTAEVGEPLRAQVHEKCHLCGHDALIGVGHEPGSHKGQVLPFRRP